MICEEIDWRSPYSAFAPLAGEPNAHLLSAGDRFVGGWSIITAFPEAVVEAQTNDGEAWLARLQELISDRAADPHPSLPNLPFRSGLVGFIGYETLDDIEKSFSLPGAPYCLPNAVFGVYNAAALFSRREQRAYVVGRDEASCRRIRNALGTDRVAPPRLPVFSNISSNFSQEEYYSAVSKVIEKIGDGDFYQANIAQTLQTKCDFEFSPFDLFRAIASRSEAAFSSFLQFPGGAVVSNSPERFFRVEPEHGERRITVEPIKGTRGRSSDMTADAKLAMALQNDPKDRAENIMIADLMRNDLSKICKDGSIREEAICELMTLANVRHLVSRISGELSQDVGIAGIFRALFPSGSITGAPKIEAMKAIAEIEIIGRGPYCGAIGYLDDCGGADFSVAIRTLIVDEDARKITIPVGGGVTLRSDPQAEYEETLIKARGVLDILSLEDGQPR